MEKKEENSFYTLRNMSTILVSENRYFNKHIKADGCKQGQPKWGKKETIHLISLIAFVFFPFMKLIRHFIYE